MSGERVELFAPGCLGTCWYGKYHYLEPWVGCEHDCDYCYARFRSVVTNSLEEEGGTFSTPVPLFPPDELISRIRTELESGKYKSLKLSRYTDPFPASLVRSGLAFRVQEALVRHSKSRIILTTKGLPDRATIDLIKGNPGRFSYNIVAKPPTHRGLERSTPSQTQRLQVAQELAGAGVLTTVHMDPLIPGREDGEEDLSRFFRRLKGLGLNRVMFSYLLLSGPMIDLITERNGEADSRDILSLFDVERVRRFLPGQAETDLFSIDPVKKTLSVRRVSGLLEEMGFSFVLCSLKSGIGGSDVGTDVCPRCDGTFYA